jgi:hypothetical protein
MAIALEVDPVHERLYQALETEQGGMAMYRTALRCVQRDEFRTEWIGAARAKMARKGML